ncbi:MAG: TraB/GumN family protein [Woeseiaceae bacterium]
MRRLLGSCLWFVLLPAVSASADQANHPVTMWQINGDHNRVYLLGSVHLLRAADHPLPAIIDSVYKDAELIIMEMDVDDVDPIEAQKLVTELGLIKDDRSLSDLMGPNLYAEAEAFAANVDIPLAMLASSEPWLAAVTVEQLMLTRIGFNPKFGIENYLASKAATDRKEIIGLETVRQQLEFLDHMTLDAQRSLLLQSLKESNEIATIMDELVHAWRYGDLDFLEREMLAEMRGYPELYKTIVVDRNRKWVDKIDTRLSDKDDYLVVVGALHLIGDEGVPGLLAERGHEVVQMHQSE